MEKQLQRLRQQLSHLPDSEWDLFTHFCTSLIITRYPDAEIRQKMIEQWRQIESQPVDRLQRLWADDRFIQIIDQSLNDTSTMKDKTRSCKDSEFARLAREHGNRLFLSRDYRGALKSYNVALLYAPHEIQEAAKKSSTLAVPGQAAATSKMASAELALAYGNRSAALFQLGNYDRALIDIELALQSGYPTDKRHVLFGRRLLCLRALGKAESIVRRALAGALQQLRRRQQTSYQFEQTQRYLQICMDRYPIDCDGIDGRHASECDGRLSPLPWRPWDDSIEFTRPGTPFVSPFASPMPTPRTSPENSEDEAEDEPDTESDLKRRNNGAKKSSANLAWGMVDNCTQIRYDPVQGRHLVASRDLPVGQLILNELPFAGWLRPSRYRFNCFECHLPLAPQQFVPCRGCIRVRYCSAECANRSWKQVHRHECAVLDTISLLSIGHLALRILWIGGVQQALCYLNLPSITNSSNKPKVNTSKGAAKKQAKNRSTPEPPAKPRYDTGAGKVLENEIPPLDQGEYTLILHLATNFNKLPVQLTYNYAVGAIFLARFCQKLGLGDAEMRAVSLQQLSAILLHHMLQVRCNARASEAPAHLLPEVHEYSLPDQEQLRSAAKQSAVRKSVCNLLNKDEDPDRLTKWPESQLRAALNSQMVGARCAFGVQVFGRLSLVNHGCAANTYTKKVKANVHSSAELLELRLASPVKQGEQLLLNYGCAWQQMSVPDRQAWLLAEYGFRCSCPACAGGWQNWPQALHCDRCGSVGGAAVVMDSAAGVARCVRCGWTLEQVQLDSRLQEVESLRRRIERLVEADDRLRIPEQGSLLCQPEDGDSNALDVGANIGQKNKSKNEQLHGELLECLVIADRLLYRDNDLMIDLHELAARSFERKDERKQACRHWVAVLASSCLNQGQASYDALLAILELSRLLCSVAAAENQVTAEHHHQIEQLIQKLERANRSSGSGRRTPEPKGVTRKKSTRKSAKQRPEVKSDHSTLTEDEEQLDKLKIAQDEHYSASESARRAAAAYFDKALDISKSLQQNEHQLLLSNANCVQRCVQLLTELNSLFNISN